MNYTCGVALSFLVVFACSKSEEKEQRPARAPGPGPVAVRVDEKPVAVRVDEKPVAPVEGLDSWAWPAYFKGRAAERLSEETLEEDSEVVHPTLRIACDEGVFKMSVWSRMSLHDGGGAATLDTHLKIDGSQELQNKATVKMGEHIHFAGPEKLAKELRGHTSLELKFDLPGGKTAILTFGLSEIEAVLDRLGDCTS